MKITHRITLQVSKELKKRLDLIGLNSNVGLNTFVISEDDTKYAEIEEVLRTDSYTDIISTTFSKRELSTSPWLQIDFKRHFGYPQEEKNFPENFFSSVCLHCGVHQKQNSPLVFLQKDLGKIKFIGQPYWLYDSLILSEIGYAEIQNDIGSSVIHNVFHLNRGEIQLSSAKQIVPVESNSMLELGDTKFEDCRFCSVRKYHPPVKGRRPKFKLEVNHDHRVIQSQEWFGSGKNAFKLTFVSQSFYQQHNNKLKELNFYACN